MAMVEGKRRRLRFSLVFQTVFARGSTRAPMPRPFRQAAAATSAVTCPSSAWALRTRRSLWAAPLSWQRAPPEARRFTNCSLRVQSWSAGAVTRCSVLDGMTK